MRSLQQKLARLKGNERAQLAQGAPVSKGLQEPKPSFLPEAVSKRSQPLADSLRADAPLPLPETLPKRRRFALNFRVERLSTDSHHGQVALYEFLQVRSASLAALARDRQFKDIAPSDLLFVDTETTGLRGGVGVVPFVVGLAFVRRGTLFVEQLQMTGLGNEVALLQRLWTHLHQARALVSYNGKSFDWPLLRSRFLMHGIALPDRIQNLAHFDLLHASRRHVMQVADHRLTTLERHLCRFYRSNDIPSAFIPLRFFAYVRGELDNVDDVLEHNRYDVLAMVAFIVALSKRFERACYATLAKGELLAVARAKYFAQEHKEALAIAHEALLLKKGEEAMAAALWAARICVKQGAWKNAARLLERALLQAPESAAPAHLALAKLFEHRFKDFPRALRHAERARSAEEAEHHQRRLARLKRRLIKKISMKKQLECAQEPLEIGVGNYFKEAYLVHRAKPQASADCALDSSV